MPLYETDADSKWGPGIPVTTQSMVKAFRRCPRETMYKYVDRLQPKILSKPLTRGKWIHALLEAHYQGLDWEREHKRWCGRFAKLFDEEKDALGDLPTEIHRLMKSYFWHYGNPEYADKADWEVVETEFTLEAMMPNGHLFRGRVDLLVRNALGLWIVDHKSHKRLPLWDHRMFDEQSPLYIWAAREMGYDVRGFIWNYLCTAPISVPRVVIKGDRFYSKMGDSDYPTFVRAVKAAKAKYGDVFLEDPQEKLKVAAELTRLKEQRWVPDAMQTSPHFRRDVIEKSDELLERVLATTMRTSDAMHSYDFSQPDAVERNVEACKGWMCSYRDLSMADLLNGESEMIKRTNYQHGDPLAYYEEEVEKE